MDERRQDEARVPPDPSGIDEPHDVLAAEEFGIGTRDERHPPDPTGIDEPHDVLAAEEFPFPARAEPGGSHGGIGGRSWLPLAVLLLGAAAGFALARRRG